MTTTTTTTTTPRIYVASLSDYNEGTLHGVWIDATVGEDHMAEETAAMLKCSPFARSAFARKWGMTAEEWGIHDYEGFGSVRLSEWESFETVATLAELIEAHGEAVTAYLEHFGTDNLEGFEDAYLGEYDSPADYAAEFLDGTGQLAEVPEWLQSHIDYDGIARDWSYSGDVTFVERGAIVYVFDNRAV